MPKITPREQFYYILGCVEAKATELSKEIDRPIEQCREFLLNQVVKYLTSKSKDINISDLVRYGIIDGS